MKMVEEDIINAYFYINKYIQAKYENKKSENKISEMENLIKKELSDIQHNLSTVDNYSLVYEDESDEYNRDLVFDDAATVSREIELQKLKNDNHSDLPFKETNYFYWKLDKILCKFYKKMENEIEL